MTRILVLAMLLFASQLALGDIHVRIADSPDQVSSYSPVFITGAVENSGSESVLIPAGNYSDCRYFIETGTTPENLQEIAPYRFEVGSIPLVWLRPGESWLFQMEIGRYLPVSGSVIIRLGLKSTGQCVYRPVGNEEFPLKLLYKNSDVQKYDCWVGDVVSDSVDIRLVVPSSAVDREAMEYLRSPESGIEPYLRSNWDLPLKRVAANLWERFPTSHYAYVGIFQASAKSPEGLNKLLEVQPSHPLTPYTRFMKALATIRSVDRKEDVSFEALDIPTALKDYLAQERAAQGKPKTPLADQPAIRPK